jgi:hypothetical protein
MVVDLIGGSKRRGNHHAFHNTLLINSVAAQDLRDLKYG